MKVAYAAVFALFVMIAAAPSAEAGVNWNDGWGCSADGSGCGGFDPFLTEGENTGSSTASGEYTLGDNMTFCTAYKQTGARCKGCTFDQNDVRRCNSFEWSGSCGCEQRKKPFSGPNITICDEYGLCDYVA